MKKHPWTRAIAKGIVLAILAAACLSVLTMLLWNAVMPDILGVRAITFWQALGLILLSHILFRGGWSVGRGFRHHSWKHRWEEKLASLPPEERERWKEEYFERCGWGPRHHRHAESDAPDPAAKPR